MFKHLVVSVFVLITCLVCCRAQPALWVKIVQADTADTIADDGKKKSVIQRFGDLKAADAYMKQHIAGWVEAGYLGASVDSLVWKDSVATAYLFTGRLYKWAKLSFEHIPSAILNNAGIKKMAWEGAAVQPKRLNMLTERLLTYCENNGYPFAHVKLGNLEETGEGVSAECLLEMGTLVRIDTIVIEGNIDISRSFLQNYIGIHQGDLYNEEQLRLISKKLSELSFLQEAAPWQFRFSIMKNELKLFLKEKRANQLNGLIGLQPNTVETGKFLLTYDILLGLKNALGYGEALAATIQRLQYKTLRFHADGHLPYLFGTPFGLEAGFDLFNRDTSFVRISFDGGIRYQLNANDYLKVFYQHNSNRIIDADVRYVMQNRQLPDNLDITSRGAGMQLNMDRTDYRLNPRKGWQGRLSVAGLIREVKKNDAILEIEDGSGFDYASLYDSVNRNKYQYRFLGELAYHFNIFKNMVVRIGYSGGYISGSELFLNELFQLGGFKLLRGFDEQSIYANQYHVGTIELRILLGQNSYFYIFNDNAYTRIRYNHTDRKDYPVSLGGGITLENKSGIFNIAIGLGKFSGHDFQFRQSRVHFGYSAYF